MPPIARWILFPALTMSLGWGLRGYIGGGPLGAMIPGALVALCLCLLLDRRGDDAAIVAAWGAVGVGFGGQMTYGQTIGLALAESTRAWGLTGLAVKGAIWGFLGGAVIALALLRHKFPRRDLLIALALMAIATFAGWKLLNEPKLIYFSHPTDRPRPEIWFGLLAGAAAMLAWLRNATLVHFALIGAVAGGIGFGFGGYIQVLGIPYPKPLIGYWKQMELFLGLMLGAGLGLPAWLHRHELGGTPVEKRSNIAIALIIPFALLAEDMPARAGYTYLGALLLALALLYTPSARHIAVTMTYCAFAIDFQRNRPNLDQTALWAFVVVTTVAVAFLVEKFREPAPLFLLLLITSVVNSMMKSFLPVPQDVTHLAAMETLFALIALSAAWLAPRKSALAA
ncbi:MAG: hypothetical protein JNK48_15270 [Bryobacterales bacterium]|nr:hypothetical protein [Bryobacterales bacterium]